MIKFDINGAIVEFDESMDNYNTIRKLYRKYAEDTSLLYESVCVERFSSVKQLSEKGCELGLNFINDIIKKSIECIVSYGVIVVDYEIFKENYCNKYQNFQRLFNNLNKELLIPNKNKRNTNYKQHELKTIISNISEFIYNDCFDIHLALIDALKDNKVDVVNNYILEDNIKKSNALFNNYKDGFITKPDECKVVKQILTLNPYREDVYEFLIQEDGDFSKEIERIANYLGYDIKPYKSTLMDIYIKQLLEGSKINIELATEKLIKYSKYIGCDQVQMYVDRIDSIYSFENA